MQNMPRDEKTLLRIIAALERRVAALETAPRAGNTTVAAGALTISANAELDIVSRAADPAVAGAGILQLYGKADRLYYIDGTGTVQGPI